jgi:putative hydrolase of the HAD superfamily
MNSLPSQLAQRLSSIELSGRGVMIKAVIFDFGRVISAQKKEQLFNSYEEDLGLATGTINQIMFDSPLWDQALLGKITMDEYWQAIGPALNLTSVSEVSSFQKRYYDDERINIDVVHLLQRLHGRYAMAILFNHPAGLMSWLDDWEIADFFDVVFCSGDEGIAKPDPKAYEITLERLGVKSSEAIFIDDTPGHVESAKAIGLSGIVFTDAASLIDELAHYIVNDLNSI